MKILKIVIKYEVETFKIIVVDKMNLTKSSSVQSSYNLLRENFGNLVNIFSGAVEFK